MTDATTEPSAGLADAPAPESAAHENAPAPADSPPIAAEGAGNEPAKTSFEALSNRLKQMQAEKGEPAPEVKADKPDAKAEGEESDDDLPGDTAEEKSAFKGKPAGDQIKGLRNKLRMSTRELNQAKGDLERLRPMEERARQFDEFTGWVKNTGLSQDDVTQGLTIMALMRSDPFKALEIVTPIYAELQRQTGAVLPDDLRAEVDSGLVTEDRAREIAQLRQRSQHVETRGRQQAEQFQQERQQQQVSQLQTQVATAVNAAELEVARNDPDYNRKKGLVEAKIKALWVDEGVPQSAQAAVAQYQKAVKLVNQDIAVMTPRGQRPGPSGQPSVSAGGNNLPAPKSSLEAMQRAAQAGGIRVTG